jgi:homoserine kinase
MRSRKTSKNPGPLELVLPATSANLGPAFDAAALAFSLFLRLRAKLAFEFSIDARGRDQEICGRLENHLIITTYLEVLNAEKKSALPLALRIDNQMPIGKGCGSSAAARLAGIALAVHFGKLGWDDARIIGEASRREHHPDNAAACWLGGLAVARMNGEDNAQFASIAPKGKWPLVFAVPGESLSTEHSRRVLPEHYSRRDVVTNLQNSMLLLTAFSQGRRDLMTSALEDRIHQPYRAALCPLFPALHELAGKNGILGVALSGAGPSVLIFLDPKSSVSRMTSQLTRHLQSKKLSAELITTSISTRGAAHRFF